MRIFILSRICTSAACPGSTEKIALKRRLKRKTSRKELEGEGEELEGEGGSDPSQEKKQRTHAKYVTMYYKAHSSFGIREAGGSQVLNICRKGADVKKLERLAHKACNSLNAGMSVDDVKLVVKHKLNNDLF